jgi:hypothetical protein
MNERCHLIEKILSVAVTYKLINMREISEGAALVDRNQETEIRRQKSVAEIRSRN